MDKKEMYYFDIVEISNYLDSLGRKIHNCIVMYEERNKTAYKSIHEIQIQLQGLGEFLDFLKMDYKFNNVLTTLSGFLYEEFLFMDGDEEEVKRQLRKCMNTIWGLKKELPKYMEVDWVCPIKKI